jgi:hypothetical protein
MASWLWDNMFKSKKVETIQYPEADDCSSFYPTSFAGSGMTSPFNTSLYDVQSFKDYYQNTPPATPRIEEKIKPRPVVEDGPRRRINRGGSKIG